MLIDTILKNKDHIEIPCYIYDRQYIINQINQIKSFDNPYWLVVRYAMKANSHKNILQIVLSQGIGIDASSEYEVYNAIDIWFEPNQIQLNSQQLPTNWDFDRSSIKFIATSLYQIEEYGRRYPWSTVWIRINPGIWSSYNIKTDTWWYHSAFGIRFEYIEDIKKVATKYNLTIKTLHTHIWSWTDPVVRWEVAKITLDLINSFLSVDTVSLWWWFKVARVDGERSIDIPQISSVITSYFEKFYHDTGRKITLEVEPGTYLVANAWYILSNCIDVVDTWKDWYNFIKLDIGMDNIIRPTMYGSRHPIHNISSQNKQYIDYVVVWHCCESGDLLTTQMDNPDSTSTVKLPMTTIWDLMLIWGAWAYCDSMSCKWYNWYPHIKSYIYEDNQII